MLTNTPVLANIEMPSLPKPSSFGEAVGDAKPLAAWVKFCENHPPECRVDLSEPDRILLTPHVWRTLLSINRQVNADIKPLTDMEHWGVADRWDFPDDGYGDCEDFQLLKRKLLIEHGLPRRAMRMTVVLDDKNEGHAVLTIITDRGDFVLDNKNSQIVAWHQTGYTFIKRESQSGSTWVSLGGAKAPSMTANR